MKIKKYQLIIGLLLTFLGGFFSGTTFSDHRNHTNPSDTIDVSQSSLNPSQKQQPDFQQEKSKVLIGYVQDFRNPNIVDYTKLSHLIFSFAHPTKDGGILLNQDWALQNLRTHVNNARKNNTKVILAVGGWYHMNGGQSYDYFKAALTNPTARTRLVNELISFVNREKLDGVDIDFEHPRSPSDAENLAIFMKELGEKLHPIEKELSVAVHAKIHGETLTEAHFVQYEAPMFKYVDHVNIMAYDGQWDGGYNAAHLSTYPFTEKIVNYWANLFDQHNLDKGKLVLGVPSYAQPEDPSIKQISYGAIIKNNPANAYRDQVDLNRTTYHYNGATTILRKTKLALGHGFGGMMIWEIGLDSSGPNSLTSLLFNHMNN